MPEIPQEVSDQIQHLTISYEEAALRCADLKHELRIAQTAYEGLGTALDAVRYVVNTICGSEL